MVQQVTPETTIEVIYPESDGQPMADNTEQFAWIVKIKENLEILFASPADIFIAGDLFWYPVKRNFLGFGGVGVPMILRHTSEWTIRFK